MNRPYAVALITLGLLASGPGAATAATRHATPNPAAGADCSSVAPCSLLAALNGATSGDTIIVGAGTHPAGDYLDEAKDLTIAGAVLGAGRPVIQGNLTLTGTNTRLTDVEVDAEDLSPALLLAGAEADRVIAINTVGDGCSLESSAEITNAVCLSLREGQASGLASQGTGAETARNVDAVGTNGLFSNNDGGLTATDAVAESRDEDDGEDVCSNSGTITLVRVAYNTSSDCAAPVSSGTVSAEPQFRSPIDFRKAPTSPTIDKGGDGSASTALDLNGNLRRIGAAVDLGAYEHVPAAPTATTSAPSTVGTTTATLRGSIDTKGGLTTYRFEYGPTPTLGSATATTTLPAGTGASPVQAELGGLPRGATVHYRIVSESDGGESASEVATFETAPLAPAATSEAPSDVTATSATARGTVETDGAAGTAHFDVTSSGGTTFSTADQAVSDGQTVTAPLAGLTPATGYAYTLVVTTRGGTAMSNTTAFATPAASPLAPPLLRPGVTLVGASARADKRRRVTLRLRCTGPAAGCSGTVGLRSAARVKVPGSRKRRRVTFGRATFTSLAAGKTTKVRVRLSRRSLRTLKALKRVGVVATITVDGASPASSTAPLRLKAPRRR